MEVSSFDDKPMNKIIKGLILVWAASLYFFFIIELRKSNSSKKEEEATKSSVFLPHMLHFFVVYVLHNMAPCSKCERMHLLISFAYLVS